MGQGSWAFATCIGKLACGCKEIKSYWNVAVHLTDHIPFLFCRCWAKTVGGELAYWFRWLNSNKGTSYDWSLFQRFSWCLLLSFMCSCKFNTSATYAMIFNDMKLFFTGAKLDLWHRLFITTFWHSVTHHVVIHTPETCSTSCDWL